MTPEIIQRLTSHFATLPGIGPRQATRFVYFLLRQSPEEVISFRDAISKLEESITLCEKCFLPKEKECSVCTNPDRTEKSIFMVEKESDALRVEKAGVYNGKYFVLGGIIAHSHDNKNIKARIMSLKKRLEAGEVQELILGLNPTREGMFTSAYIEEVFKSIPKDKLPHVTRLGRGLTTGAELEYVDEETLRSALEGRK